MASAKRDSGVVQTKSRRNAKKPKLAPAPAAAPSAPELTLADLIDAPALQGMMDDFHRLVGIPMAVIDLKGKVLVGVGWQDICTKFHRVHPETCRNCVESDTQLSGGVPDGEYRRYRCKNNLWDVATPIKVAGQHVGNVFCGQFFIEGETPDREVFRAQARRYGFPEEAYLAALDRVPRFSQRQVDAAMGFFLKLAQHLSQMGWGRLQLAREISQRQTVQQELTQVKEDWERTFDSVPDLIAILDPQHRILRVNGAMAQRLGREPAQCIGLHCYESVHGLMGPHDSCPHARTMQDGLGHDAELNETRMGGDFLVTTTPLRDSRGQLTGAVHVARDITERKRAEKLLQAQLGMVATDYTDRPLAEVMRQTLDHIEAQTGSVIGFFHFMEPDQKTLSLQTWSTNTVRTMCQASAQGSHYDIALAGVWVDCVRQRQPVIHNDYASLPHRKGLPAGHAPVTRELVVPVLRRERIVAVIGVGNKPSDYDATDIEAVSVLGDLAWEIIERKRAQEALRANARRLALLSETTAELLRAEDPQKAVESLCRKVMETLDCQAFFNYLVDEQAGRLHLNAAAGIPEADARQIEWLDFGSAVCGCAARDACRIVATDIQKGGDPRTELIKSFGIRAYACHPLLFAGRVIGTLSFGTRSRDSFSEEELATMKTVAAHVAIAMTRKREETRIRELNRMLNQSEELLRLFVENAPVAMAMLDRDMRYIRASRRWLTDFRLKDDILGKSHYEIFPEVPEHWKQVHRRCLAGATEGCDEEPFPRVDGKTDWIRWEIRPWYRAPGDVGGIIIFSEDITERRSREEELRRLNRMLRAHSRSALATMRATEERAFLEEVCHIIVEDCGHAMVWIGFAEHDEAKTIRPIAHAGIDEGYLQQLHLTWADTDRGQGPGGTAIRTGKPCICRDMMSEPAFAPWREAARKRGYASSLVVPLLDGKEAFGELTVYAKQTDAFSTAEVELLSDLARDLARGITMLRLRAAHDQAEAARSRLAAIVASSSDAIISKTLEGIVTSWNKGAEQLYGYSAQEAVGRPVSMLLPPGQEDEDPTILERIKRGEAVPSYETVRRAKDGRDIEVFLTVSPVADEHGAITGASTTARDITERKRLERLERQQAEEIRLGATRLEAVNKELESFSYTVSHDLRAPLRHINGFVDLLSSRNASGLDEQGQRYLGIIADSAKRMGELIDGLLSFSRLGKNALRPVPTDLAALVAEVRQQALALAPERRIEWKVSELPRVQADLALLRVVLTNLIGNAVKFTGGREVAVIEMGARPAEGGQVEVFIRDNGAGFDMAYQDKLFGVFQRLHRSEEFEGTGIGLATVRRIIARHGGTVRAEGELGKGACFYFTLPSAEETN